MDTIIEHFKADSLFYTVNLLALVLIGFCVWMYSQIQHNREVSKLKAEMAKLQLNQWEHLNLLENRYHSSQKEILNILKELRTALNENRPLIATSKRNELSGTFFDDYVDGAYKYLRTADKLFEDDNFKKEGIINNHVYPFLEISSNVMEILNQTNVTQMTQSNKIPVRESTFEFAYNFISDNIEQFDVAKKRRLKHYKKRLQNAG